MTRPFPKFRNFLHRFRRSEEGTGTVEFALAVPLLFSVFMASFESGMLMIRSIMLEQSVDMTMRELRLGHYPIVDADLLKTEICNRSIVLVDCEDNIMIEMTRVSTANWTMPSTSITCVDREEAVQPVLMLQIGQQNEIMLMRVCVVQETLFPTTGIGLGLPKDSEGGYGLTAVTAFVTEPS